jgi:hypothetical protein
MMMMMNWKTTIPGILALLAVGWNAWQTKTINIDDIVGALVGLGLVGAKDWDVVGGTRRQ